MKDSTFKQTDSFPPPLAQAALRALANAGISSASQLAAFSKKEIAGLHGIGKNAMLSLAQYLEDNGLTFKQK